MDEASCKFFQMRKSKSSFSLKMWTQNYTPPMSSWQRQEENEVDEFGVPKSYVSKSYFMMADSGQGLTTCVTGY